MSFWAQWSWDVGHFAVIAAEIAVMYAIHRIRRGWRPRSRHCTAHLGEYCHCTTCKRTRSARIEGGKPPPRPMSPADLNARVPHTRQWRCTQCDGKLKRRVYHPPRVRVKGLWLDHGVQLCPQCIMGRPERAAWIEMEIRRY